MLIKLAYLSKYSTFSSITLPMFTYHNQPTNDIIIIRHAQSNFNKGWLDYRAINNLDISWDECIKIKEFNQTVSYAKEFIDCSITESGKLQCQIARSTLKYVDIDVVLVSPYQRALETCHEIFGDRGIKVEVHPVLAEVFRYSCDVGHHIEQKSKQFSQFDFSFMKDHSELWFIENLSQHIKETCKNHFQAKGQMSYEQKQHKLLQLLQSKVVYESPLQLRMRTWRIKQLLAEYNKKYKKIAIVSHFYTIATLTASQFDQNSQVVDFPDILNATPIFTSLQKLQSVK